MLGNIRNICSPLIIILIAFLSYFNTFSNAFHFDDYSYILHNVEFKIYDDIIKDIIRTCTNNEEFEKILYPCFSIGHTLENFLNRSIVLATLHLNHSLDGFNVFGFHVFNLLVHLLTSFLIFLFVKETLFINKHFKIMNKYNLKLNIPLIAALLFAVHPINTQAVTYITGRTTALAVCFYMASFLFFIKGIRQNLPYKILFFIFSMVFLIAGFGSKMIVLTAPVMFVIYFLFFVPLRATFLTRFFKSRFARITIQTIVVLSPFGLIFISKFLDFEPEYFVYISEKLHAILGTPIYFSATKPLIDKLFFLSAMKKDAISSSIYLLTEFKIIVFFYIKMIFFPFNQNIDPDFPIAHGMTDPGVVLSLCAILLCLFASIYYFKKNRLISFGIFWFFVTLSLTSSVLPLTDLVVEHRLYLSSVGIVTIIPVFLNSLISSNNTNLLKQLTYFVLLVFLPIIVLSSLTVKRNFVWKNEKSLWSDAAEKSPRLSRPLNNLAEAYDKEGLAYGDKKNYARAIEALNKAIAISPTGYKSFNNLGKIYGLLGKHESAIKNLKLALKYNPDYPIAHYNLGKVYELMGKLDNAIDEHSAAFKKQGDFFEACFNLANLYDQKRQYKKALNTYLDCRRFKPSFPKIYFAIGNIFFKIGNLSKAIKNYSRSIELNNEYHPAKIALANIFLMKGNFNDAVKLYRQVIKSDPDNFEVHNNLGLVFLQHLNNPSQAVHHFKKSLDINPVQQKVTILRDLIKKLSGVIE